jgi:hypothetical protein
VQFYRENTPLVFYPPYVDFSGSLGAEK